MRMRLGVVLLTAASMGCATYRGKTYVHGMEAEVTPQAAREAWVEARVALLDSEYEKMTCGDGPCPSYAEMEEGTRKADLGFEVWCDPGESIGEYKAVTRILVSMPGSRRGWQTGPTGMRVTWDERTEAGVRPRGPRATGPKEDLLRWFETHARWLERPTPGAPR